MTNDETAVLMGILKTAYPEYYKGMSRQEAENTVSLWAEMLSKHSLEVCMMAVKKLIAESPFAPKIADIVKRIDDTEQLTENRSDPKLWMITAWQIRSWRNVHEQLGITLPPEIMKLCYGNKMLTG